MTKIIHCSFCQKKHTEVRKVIAGPNDIFICDECVMLCVEITQPEEWPTGTSSSATTS